MGLGRDQWRCVFGYALKCLFSLVCLGTFFSLIAVPIAPGALGYCGETCAMFTNASLLSPMCDHLNAPWSKLWTFVATAAVNTFSITAADFTSTTNSYYFRCVCEWGFGVYLVL